MHPRRNVRDDRGFALPLVLAFVLVVCVVTSYVTAATRRKAQLAAAASDKAVAYGRAYSALNEVAFELATAEWTPTAIKVRQGDEEHLWNLYGKPITFGEGVTVRLEDLGGKLSPLFSPELVADLAGETPQTHGSGFARLTPRDTLADWADVDDFKRLNGAEEYDYRRLGLPYTPRNGPVQLVEELALVPGFKPEALNRISGDLAYWGTFPQNTLTMSPALWRMLLGSEEKAAELARLRDQGSLDGETFLRVTALPPSEDFRAWPTGWVRATVEAKQGVGASSLTAVLGKRPTKDRPFVVAEWRP